MRLQIVWQEAQFSKPEFKRLLQLPVKDSLYIFNGKYYIQPDLVAMGSPLGPIVANVFLCYWEINNRYSYKSLNLHLT